MKIRRFLNVVPKPVKVAASIVFAVAILVGALVGAAQWYAAGLNSPEGPLPALSGAAIGLGLGLLVGTLIAIWLLCVGYVYADALRRAMPAVLWVLIVIFVPNLLGFLLYFALRRPLVFPCPSCGQWMAADQRFCASCGSQRTSPASEGFPSPGSGIGPTAAV